MRAVGHNSLSRQPHPAPAPPAATIEFTLVDEGRVSLNIYNSDGRIVRELMHATPRPAGSFRIPWDGRDFADRPLPPGEYTWKLLSTRGLHAHFVTALGTSPNPAWELWPGNYGGIFALCYDGGSLFFGSYGAGTIALVKQSLSGKRDWVVPTAFEPWQGPIALARTSDKLYSLQPNGMVYRLDADTSEMLGRFDVRWRDDKGATKSSVSPRARADLRPQLSPYSQPADMACFGDQIAISDYVHDEIRWYQASTGLQLDKVTILRPLGIAFAKDGKLLVITDGTIAQLSPISKKLQPVVTGIPDAYRIAVDTSSGDMLIGEQGASQQVLRYSIDGKLVKTYGARGGRRPGRYNPADFCNITSITPDASAGFCVAEASAPRRIARFDFNGNLVHEWIGPQPPEPFAVIDADDPTSAWGESSEARLLHYRLDLKSQSWTIEDVYDIPQVAAERQRQQPSGPRHWLVRRHGDNTYLCTDRPLRILRVDELQGRLIPMVAVMTVDPVSDIKGTAIGLSNNHASHARILWTDLNGDGTIDAQEVVPADGDAWTATSPVAIDRDLGLCATAGETAHKLTVKDWSASGAPEYGPEKTVTFDRGDEPELKLIDTEFDASGEIWSLCAADVGGGHVLRGLVKWMPDGKIRFAAGVTQEYARMDELVGIAHGCIAVADPAEGDVDVWDPDGLWVGQFLEQPDLSAAPRTAYRLPDRTASGSVYTDPRSEDVYFVAQGINNNPVLRIGGWTGWERHSGGISLRK